MAIGFGNVLVCALQSPILLPPKITLKLLASINYFLALKWKLLLSITQCFTCFFLLEKLR